MPNMPSTQTTLSKAQLRELYRAAIEEGVPFDVIAVRVKKWQAQQLVLAQRETQQSERVVRKVKRQLPLVVRIGVGLAPIASVLVGLVLVGNAALPLAWYYVHPDVAEANLVTPLTEVVETARDEPIVQSAAPTPASELPQEPTVIAEELSYTNLTHWFAGDVLPAQPMAALPGAQVLTEYMLTIPKLNISQAKVKIGSVDLSKSLVQYSGTANPGDPGAPVIFGHSVLRQFYNPSEKNTRRLKLIRQLPREQRQGR
jgi:hypothetical protein